MVFSGILRLIRVVMDIEICPSSEFCVCVRGVVSSFFQVVCLFWMYLCFFQPKQSDPVCDSLWVDLQIFASGGSWDKGEEKRMELRWRLIWMAALPNIPAILASWQTTWWGRLVFLASGELVKGKVRPSLRDPPSCFASSLVERKIPANLGARAS